MAELAIEKAIRKILQTDPSVGFVYPQIAPENASLPFIVYSRISSNHQFDYSGASGLNHIRLQLNIFAETYAAVKSKANDVRGKLQGYTDTVTIDTESVDIQVVKLLAEHDDIEKPKAGSDNPVFWIIQDYLIGYTET